MSREKSVKWASLTILGMLLVLLGIMLFTGGLTGLSGVGPSLAYFGIVTVPILILIALANKKIRKSSSRN
ncbi:MAG TPA: hypothetical protein VFE98_07105 [Candidatus Bathyarchaeia archaeon]|nr:hypothetical protein [Candidatus Bathyarchaeia archaeon]